MAQQQDTKTLRERYRIYIYPVVLAWLVTMFVRPIISDGAAMNPSIQEGELIIVANHTYSPVRGTPEFQQVVAFRDDFIDEGEKGDNRIRRVIGLPGDTIEIKDGRVYRNGEALIEEYATGTMIDDMAELKVGEDQVFVLGDNREDSIDSRDERVGTLSLKSIRGSCMIALWPLDKFGTIK